jgi:hypothetical protein
MEDGRLVEESKDGSLRIAGSGVALTRVSAGAPA